MEKRWLWYMALGLVFGVIDWFFLQVLAVVPMNLYTNEVEPPAMLRLLIITMIVSLNYGIWLIPAVPLAIVEYKHSQSLRRSAQAAIIVWVMALFSYYLYYAGLLMFSGIPHLDFMLFSNRQSPGYWADWWPPFRQLIVFQFFEWVGIGILGGAIIGVLSALGYRAFTRRRRPRTAQPH